LTVPLRGFAHWNSTRHDWETLAGKYVVYVGDSSRSVKAIPVEIKKGQRFAP